MRHATTARLTRLPAPAALAALIGLLLCALVAPPSHAAAAGPVSSLRPSPWTGTWSTTVTGTPASDSTTFENQTIRQIVRGSIGGGAVRVRLSNEFGTTPLAIGEAHVALREAGADDARTAPGTDRPLTFGGRASMVIPAGSPAVSDPVTLSLPAGADLVISVFLPDRTAGSTLHAFAFQHNYVAEGNVTARQDIEPTRVLDRWYFLSGVSVQPRTPGRAASAVVALGDSITDGGSSTTNANRRWPDVLAERLRGSGRAPAVGVLNQGISGNRLLHDPNPPAGSPAQDYAAYFGQSALRRFDRDVVAQPGAGYVIVLLGVNDLGHPGTVAPESERVSAADIIAGHRQLIARAHGRGLKIFGGTITPFAEDTLGFSSPENEAARMRINTWIRTSGEYDGVIDFDAALRDPRRPDHLLARYDGGDHLHPNDAGMNAMAHAVPLSLFR